MALLILYQSIPRGLVHGDAFVVRLMDVRPNFHDGVKKRKGKKKKRHRVRTRWYGGGGLSHVVLVGSS